MKLEECQISTRTIPRLNMGPMVMVLVDGQPIIICTNKQVGGIIDFFDKGYNTELLNNTQKNHLMKELEKHPSLRLYSLHPITGEPMFDEPIIRGKINTCNYLEVKLFKIVEG